MGEIRPDQRILDPCVGPGIFIEGLLKAGVNGNQIHAFDINEKYGGYLEELNVRFIAQDTLLDNYQDSHYQFDFIVGNPPYLNKASKYVRDNRGKLKKIYGKINAHETYSMFIVNSLWRLKEGGKLGFITSDSFLTLKTHEKLRKFILNNCKIDEILLAPKNLFDDQKVSTSPVIMILTKMSGDTNKKNREENTMKIIPRINDESEYLNPHVIHELQQEKYDLLPFNLFFTDVEEGIINMFEKASRLKEYLNGFIGMHTHNNLKYIAAVEGTELAGIFQKRNNKTMDTKKKHVIISENELKSDKWKPYLKRGGADQYYRPILEALNWEEKSIPIYDIPKNVPFEQEGIVISGVSSRLAARYMPEGCYWDSNKAIGFMINDDVLSIEYLLGLLNSSLYNYLAKGVINNTNSIQLTGIKVLPIILPDSKTKLMVERLVIQIIKDLKRDINQVYTIEQRKIDDIIFDYYSSKFHFSESLRQKLKEIYSIYGNN